ncbi:MAG TPA: ATP-binding cassette domain-containing protein [Bacillota bacterium]|nr:ATP-binding cassette domain-containing protein [Bacillota bacterium]
MGEYIIEVSGLKKVFKVNQRGKAGMLAAVKNLFHRSYQEVTAVDGIDLAIEKGEIRGLIGPNGAGKSTTIKILSGILYPSAGTVNVAGYVPWLERVEYVKKIGVVFGQKSQLWWDLPPIDSFTFNQEMYRIPRLKFQENLNYFINLFNIEDVIKKPVRQLSLGERMKCELVCALLHEPPLVYLDEPTIGLDLLSKEAIRSFIKQTNKDKGTTFIVTTHDLADIENLCDNVTIINKGTIVYNDSLNSLRTYFSDRKVIELKFSSAVSEEELRDFRVIEYTPRSAKVEINLKTNELKSEVYQIFSNFPVQDMNINNIEIEEVIKYIYKN